MNIPPNLPETPDPLALRSREAAAAAAALGISPRKWWAMTAAGEVPHVRLGRAIVYPAAQLRDWLETVEKKLLQQLASQGAEDAP